MSQQQNQDFDDMNKLPVPEFSLDEIAENSSIAMIAKRGSGKSFVAKAILEKFKHIPVGIIISPTEQDNPYYSKFFPSAFIFYEYNSDIIKKLMVRQRLIIKKALEKSKQGKFIDPRAIIVMDDCLASKGSWAKDPAIYDLLYNGRHRQIMYILTMQFPLGIKPELRSNFDYVFLLADDQGTNIRRLYDHYAGMFPDYNSFRQIFRQLTENYGSMVLRNRGARGSLLEKIAFYRAPDLRNAQINFGCKQFRKYDELNYDKEWEDKKFAVDYDDFLFDKKKSKISVKKIFKQNEVQPKKYKLD